MSIPSTVFSLCKAVIEHRLKVYAETAAEDAALLAKDLRRRLLGAAVAMAGVLMCLMLGSAWIVGAVWDTPWRNPVLAALLGSFLICTITGAALAVWPFKPGRGPFARLRQQVGADLSLLSAICNPGGLPHTGSATALGIAMRGGGSSASETFPRSTVMRVLLGVSGLARFFQ